MTLLAIVLLAAAPHGSYGAPAAGAALTIPRLGSGGLLLLGNGAVLAWSADSHIRIRSSAGSWGSVVSLPATALDGGISVQDGVLVLGERSQGSDRPMVATIFRLDSSGRITDSWELPNMPVNSLVSAHGQLWASTATGIVELRPGGITSKIREAESSAILVTFEPNLPVICVPADLSKAHFAPSHCYTIDAEKWRAQTAWTRPPIACADFLVECGASQVAIRLANNGKVVSHAPLAAKTAIACGQGAELLLGGSDITALSLPDLKPRWTSPLKRGRVTALVRAGNGVVAFTEYGPVDLSLRTK